MQEHPASQDPLQADKALLSLAGIYEFANVLRAEDVCAVLDRQIACNTQIASEGLAHPYGACVGRTLMQEYDAKDIRIRATAMAAAGSDARMSGCPMPVVIDLSIYNVGHSLKNSLGVLEAFDMTTEAVVAKLMWLLALTDDPNEVQKLFYTPVANDILRGAGI